MRIYCKWTRLKPVVVIFSVALIITCCLNFFVYLSNINYMNTIRSHPVNRTDKYILLYNTFFNSRNWYLFNDSMAYVGPKFFKHIKCPQTACYVTANQSMLDSMEDFDAVVFHTSVPFPVVHSIPPTRSYHQKYVFANMEPPVYTLHYTDNEDYFYNWTMTYRLDSDVLWAYSGIRDIEFNQIVAPRESPPWRKPDLEFNDEKYLNLTKSKSITAAWFVSRCHASSKRGELAEVLQKYLTVDIYGACGPLKCTYEPECKRLLETKYFFYLAFENSICEDYVTEKLYYKMYYDIVPVVYGGGDYSKFAPPHSYIDANEFETVEKLAEYLKYLTEHPEEYVKYFWWKKYYEVISNNNQRSFCKLCEKLHSSVAVNKDESYRSMRDWWFQGKCSYKPKIKFI